MIHLGKLEEMSILQHHLFGTEGVNASVMQSLETSGMVVSERVQMPGLGAGYYTVHKITDLGRKTAREIFAKYDALQPKETDNV